MSAHPYRVRFGRLAAIGAASLACAGTAVAAPVKAARDTADMTIVDSVLHDAGTAMVLIGRQLGLPFKLEFGLPILLGVLALAVVLLWPLRLWLLARLSAFLNAEHHNTRLAVYAKAVGAVIVTLVLFAVAGQVALAGLEHTLPLLPETRILAQSLAVAIGVAGLGLGIGRALRSPDAPSQRPVALPPGLGRAIGFYPFAAGITLGLTSFIDQASRVLHATTTSWTIAQGLIVLAEAMVIARFLVLAGNARERQVETAAAGKDAATVPAIFGMTAIAWGALVLGCGAFLFGWTHFAILVLQEMLWMGLVLTTAWLLTNFFDALVARLLDPEKRAGRFATAIVGVRQARVMQAALLGSAILTVAVWLFAIGLVAAPLRGDHTAVVEQIRPSPLLQSLESLNISPRSLGMALVVLFVGIALTRMFRRWLERRFLPSTALDVGARTSIVTGLSYVGVIIAMLAATNMLGVQLEKITLIASALSVGIGFGLQSIIQNFVSGVILLIERPVKLGDWVAVSGAEGTIRKIRVRATELATADGGISIVPNSAFISSTVANRGDSLMSERIDLAVTVSGCATAAQARDMVLDLVKASDVIRDDPAPRIYLRTLGDGEWGFDLKLYANAGASAAQARSDLLFWLSAQLEGKEMKIKLG